MRVIVIERLQLGPAPIREVHFRRWRFARIDGARPKRLQSSFANTTATTKMIAENVAALRSSRAIPRESIEASARTSRPSANISRVRVPSNP
jgi:hypothetical protein